MEVFNNLLASQGHESAMKQALYNTLAFVFVVVFASAGIALYFILEPFVQPLLWALLFGSVLHPFKQSLSKSFREWLARLDVPVSIAVTASPLLVFHKSSNMFSRTVWKNKKLLIIVALLIVVKDILPLSWLVRTIQIAHIFFGILLQILNLFSSAFAVGTLLMAFVITLVFKYSDTVKPVFHLLTPLVYISLLCYITTVSGVFGIYLAVGLTALIIIGFFADIEDKGKCGPKTSEKAVTKMHDRMTMIEITIARKLKLWYLKVTDWLRSSDETEYEEDDQRSQSPPLIKVDDTDAPPEENSDPSNDSDLYLIVVSWACVIVHIYRNLRFLPLLYIPLLYSLSKNIFARIFATRLWENLCDSVASWYEERASSIHPPFLFGSLRLMGKGDRKLKLFLEDSVDSIISVFVIILMFLGIMMGAVVMAVKVYGESVYIVEITSGVINRTVVQNPELQQLVPETINSAQNAIDSVLADAYTYGKEWIRSTLKNFLIDKDPIRAESLERDVVALWDRIYNLYLTQNDTSTTGPSQDLIPASFSWNTLLSGMKTVEVNSILQNHYETLLTVIDSVWTILMSNISILFSVVTASVSVVLGGGTAVLNFILNFIVFTTALFYLLAASDTSYKPIQLLSSAIPNSKGKRISGLGKAVEQAINGVFALSFKMALFYGLYTWLIHSLFNVNIVFIPSLLAAVFGAVPFLGTYWACLPAILELWLINGNPIVALFMLICQILPLCFVDSAIYSEIKGGGHPYLTGLAIAGGVFCMGVQGALFGPMLLCVMIAACNVYSKLVRKSNYASALEDLTNTQPVPRMKKRASFSGQLVTERQL